MSILTIVLQAGAGIVVAELCWRMYNVLSMRAFYRDMADAIVRGLKKRSK